MRIAGGGPMIEYIPTWFVYVWDWDKRSHGEFLGEVKEKTFLEACEVGAFQFDKGVAANVFASKKKLH